MTIVQSTQKRLIPSQHNLECKANKTVPVQKMIFFH